MNEENYIALALNYLKPLHEIPDVHDREAVLWTLSDGYRKCWLLSDVVSFVKCLEHYDPELPEDIALERMSQIQKSIIKMDEKIWLDSLIHTYAKSKYEGMDMLYNDIDNALLDGNYHWVKLILTEMGNRVNNLPGALCLGLLTITLYAKDVLGASRSDFFAVLKQHYLLERPDELERLLRGLE